MSTTPPSVGELLAQHLAGETNFQVGFLEAPVPLKVENLPVAVVQPITGRTGEGDMQDAQSIDAQAFMVVMSATLSNSQLTSTEQRITDALMTSPGSIAALMGPPSLLRYGWSRQDDRVYRGIVIATFMVTAK